MMNHTSRNRYLSAWPKELHAGHHIPFVFSVYFSLVNRSFLVQASLDMVIEPIFAPPTARQWTAGFWKLKRKSRPYSVSAYVE